MGVCQRVNKRCAARVPVGGRIEDTHAREESVLIKFAILLHIHINAL
jgi:hypothetical protein